VAVAAVAVLHAVPGGRAAAALALVVLALVLAVLVALVLELAAVDDHDGDGAAGGLGLLGEGDGGEVVGGLVDLVGDRRLLGLEGLVLRDGALRDDLEALDLVAGVRRSGVGNVLDVGVGHG
jgi:hypothetical protein